MEVNKSVQQVKYLITTVVLAGVSTNRSIWHNIESDLINVSSDIQLEDLSLIVLESTLDNMYFLMYPRDHAYISSVLEWFINLWKKYDWDGCDFFEVAKPKINKPLCIGYKTYIGLYEGVSFTLLESLTGITNGTTGLVPWGAAKVLYSWITNHPLLLKGENVIELGAGTGFLTVALLSSSNLLSLPLSITATDCNPSVLSVLQHNIGLLNSSEDQVMPSKESMAKYIHEMDERLQLEEEPSDKFSEWRHTGNFCFGKTEVRVKQLDWRLHTKEETSYGVIVAADVVYARHLIPYLVKTIRIIFDRYIMNKRLGYSPATNHADVDIQSQESSPTMNTEHKEEENGYKLFSEACLPVAYIACTRRSQETISEFTKEVVENQMDYQQIYQTNLSKEEALFAYDESHLPVKILKIFPKCSN